jgi:hypothetical protein
MTRQLKYKGGGNEEKVNSGTLILFFLLSVLYMVFAIFSFLNEKIEIISISYLYAIHIIYTCFLFYVMFTNETLIKEFSIGSRNDEKEVSFPYGELYSINTLFLFGSVTGMLTGIISLTMIIVIISYMVDYYGKDVPLKNLSIEHAEKLKNYKIIYIVSTGLSLILALMFTACYMEDLTVFIRNVSGIVLTMAVISFSVIQLVWSRQLLTIKLDHLVS